MERPGLSSMNAMREGQASEKQGWKSGPSSFP